jgi:ATP-dependent Lon protease
MRCVVLPAANAADLELLPDEVRESVVFELVRTMDEVMDAVLVGRSSPRPHAAEPDLGIRLPHG